MSIETFQHRDLAENLLDSYDNMEDLLDNLNFLGGYRKVIWTR